MISVGAQLLDQPPDAKSVVDSARSIFPGNPVTINGTITVRKNRGIVVKELEYSLKAKWIGTGGELAGTLTDALGRGSGTIDLSFKKGEYPLPVRKADAFVDENCRIKGTALDCFDLLMPFLWWDDFELTGKEKSRGRDCYVINFKAPAGFALSRVKVWIDSSIFVVLKAEIYSSEDKRTKAVSVKSFKNIDDQWMIKDLEVVEESSSFKTIVTVDEMFFETHTGGKK